MAYKWSEEWKVIRVDNIEPVVWDSFLTTFLDHFIPQEFRKAEAEVFLNFKLGNMSFKEYPLKF